MKNPPTNPEAPEKITKDLRAALDNY